MASIRETIAKKSAGRKKGLIQDLGVSQEEVARAAHDLYVQRGRADGHDMEDWLKAESLVVKRHTAGRNI